ncbi:MAG: TRAP transporter small permease subunit [Gammaproteobacteria bacterium]|nr:TRAP transporter small permease subunit [Gammaproteobacteria bacterium]
MNGFADAIERFIDWCGRAVSWLTLFMVVITFIVVVLRYLFDTGWIAVQESISYMHAAVFLVGAAYTLQHDAHVRVDIFYSRFGEQARAWVNLCGALFMLMPFMFFIGWMSWEYVLDSWDVLEGSREAGGLPGVFLLKSLILVMATLLMLQATAQVLRNLNIVLHGAVNNDGGHD